MEKRGKNNIPDDYAMLLGRIAEGWAQLEFSVDFGIWQLLETPQQLAACVTSQISFIHPRMKSFIALTEVRQAGERTIKELKTLYGDRISPLSEKRNRAVHDPRMYLEENGEIHRLDISARGKVHFGFVPEPIDHLAKIYNEIVETFRAFETLRDKAIFEITSQPKEFRPRYATITRTH